MIPLAVLAAFLLDLALGDPRWLPHPVRWIGRLIEWLEGKLRRDVPDSKPVITWLQGVVLAAIVVGAALAGGWLFVLLLSFLHPALGFLAHVLLIFYCLGGRSLWDESGRVERFLGARDLDGARAHLARIVGRDTAELPEGEVVRGTVESVAENLVDGAAAPLFYAFLGGGPLALAYRAVNTLDSIVGYRNERYRHFGWASARLDDLAGYIPARLVGLLFPLACRLVEEEGGRAWRVMWRDGRKHPSPNAGIPEAAMAGALGVELGGRSTYGGVPSEKPKMGEAIFPLAPWQVGRARRLMLASSSLFVLIGFILSVALLALAWGGF